MDKGERMGFIMGTAGATLGALLWLVILGIVIRSILLIVLPVIFGLTCVVAAVKLYSMRPQKKLSIMGLAILWLIFWNSLLANFYYERIPQNVGTLTTGKNQFSLMHINIMLAVFFLAGCVLIVKDILSEIKNP